jgi:hypothetical protein
MAKNSESNLGVGFTASMTEGGRLTRGRPSMIKFNSKVEIKKVYGYPFSNLRGSLSVVDSILDLEEFTCEVSTGSFDLPEFERVFDQFTTQETNLSLPDADVYKVGAGGTVTLTGVVANQLVGMFFEGDKDSRSLKQIFTGVPTADEYIVTANTVTLHSSRVGQDLIVCYYRTITSVEALGVTSNPMGSLSYFGKWICPRMTNPPFFYIPKMNRASGLSLGSSGESSMTYDCVVKTGFALPIITAFGMPL